MSDPGPNSLCDDQKLYNFIYDDVDDSDIFATDPLNNSSAESDLKSETEQNTLHPTTQHAEDSAVTEALRQQLDKLQTEKKLLELKISELYKTARAEIDRKDKRLKQLEKERDDILFKRGQHKFGLSQNKVESRVPVLQQVDNEEVNNHNLRYRIPKKKNTLTSDHETCEPSPENNELSKNTDGNIRKRNNFKSEHKDNDHWSAYPYLKGTTSRYEDKYLGNQSDDKNKINRNWGRSRSKSRHRHNHRSPEFHREKPRTPSRERDEVLDKPRSICENGNIKSNDDHCSSKTRTKSTLSDSYAHNRNNRSKSKDRDSENSKKTKNKLEDKESKRSESDILSRKEKHNTRSSRSSSRDRHTGDAREIIREPNKSQSRRSRSISRERPNRSKSRPRHKHKSPEFHRRQPRTPSRERAEVLDKPRSMCEDGNIKSNDDHENFKRSKNKLENKRDSSRDRHMGDAREVIIDPKKRQSRRSRSLSQERPNRSKSRPGHKHRSPEFYRGKPRTPSRERNEVLDQPRSVWEDENIKSNDHDRENFKRSKNKLENKRDSSRDRNMGDAREVIRDLKKRQSRRSRSLSHERPNRSKSRPGHKHRSPEFFRGNPRTPSRERNEVSDQPRLICEDGNIRSNDDHFSSKTRTKSTSDSYAHHRNNRSKSRDHDSENAKRSKNELEARRDSSRDRHTGDAREVNSDLKTRQSRRSRSLSQEKNTRQDFKRGRSASKGRYLRKSPEKRKFENKDNQRDRINRGGRGQNYSQRDRNNSSSEEREESENYQIEDNTVRRDRYGNILFKYNDYRNRPRQTERPSRFHNWERASRPTNVRRLRERLMRHSLEKESAALRNVLKENKSRCMDSGRIDNETDHSDLDDLKLHLSGESDLDSLKHYSYAKNKRDEQTHSEDDEDLELLKNLGLDAENMTDEQLENLLEERKQELNNKSILNPNDINSEKFKNVQHVFEKGHMFEDQNYNGPTDTREKNNAWNPFDVNEDLDYEMSPMEHEKEETYFKFDTKYNKTNIYHESTRKDHPNMDGIQVNQIKNKKKSLMSDDDRNKPTFRTLFEARQHKKVTTKVGSNVPNDEPPRINRVDTHIEQEDNVRESLNPMLRERKKSSHIIENDYGSIMENLDKQNEANLDNKNLIKMTQKFTEEKIQQLKVQCSTTSKQMHKLKINVTDISKSRLSNEAEEKGINENRLIKLIVEEKQAVVSSKPKEKITLSAYKKRSVENSNKKTDPLDNCITNVSEKSQLKTNTFPNHIKSATPIEHIENHTKTSPVKIDTKTPKSNKIIDSSSTLPNNALVSEKESQSIQNNSIGTSTCSNKNIVEEQPLATDNNFTVKELASKLVNQNKSNNERDDDSKDVSSFLHDLSISDDEDEVPVQVITACNQEEKVENEPDKIKILSNIAIQNSGVNLSNVPTPNEPIEKLPLITESIPNKSVEKVECIEEIQQAVSNIMNLNNSKPRSPLNKNSDKLNTEELQKCLEEDIDQTQTKKSNTQDGNIEKTDKAKQKFDRIEVVTNKRNANIVFISSPLKREMKSKRQIRMTLLPEEKPPDFDSVTADINNDDTMQRLFGYMTPSPCKFSEKIPNEPNKEKVKRKVIDENDYQLGADTFKIRDKKTEDVQENVNKCISKEDQLQIKTKVKQHSRQRSKSVNESMVIEMMQREEEVSILQNGEKEMEKEGKLNNWQKFSNNPTYIPNLKEKKIVAFDSPNHYIQKKNQELIKRRRQSLDAKLLDINNYKNSIEDNTPDSSINLKTKLEDENVHSRKTLNTLEKTEQSKQNKSCVTKKGNLSDQNTEIKPDENETKKLNCNLKLNKPKKKTKKSPLKKTKSPAFKIKLVQQKRQKNNAKEILPNKKRKTTILVSESSKSEPEIDEIKDKKCLKVKNVKKTETKTQKVKKNEKETASKDENINTESSNFHKEQILVTLPGKKRNVKVLVSESSSESELDKIKDKKHLNLINVKKTESKTLKVKQNEEEINYKKENTGTELGNSHKEQVIVTLPSKKRKANILVSESSKSESELDEIKNKKASNVKKVTKTKTKTQKVEQNDKETSPADENISTELSNSHKEQIKETLLKETKIIGVSKKEIKNLKDNQEDTEKEKKKETKDEKNKRSKKAQKETVCINSERDVGCDIPDNNIVPVLTKDKSNLGQPFSNDSTNDTQESFKTIKRITPKRIGDSSFKMKNEIMYKDLKAKRELFSGNSCTEPVTTNKRKLSSSSTEDIRAEKVQKLVYRESSKLVEDHIMDNAAHTHIKIHETRLDIEVAPNSSPLPRIEQTYEECTKAKSGSSGTDLNKSPFIDVKNPQLQPSHEGVFPDIQLQMSNSTFNEINLDTKDIDMLGEVERAIYFNLPDMSMSDKSLVILGGEKKSGKDSGDGINERDRDETNMKDKDHLSFSNFLNKNDNTSTPIRSRSEVNKRILGHHPSGSYERDAKHEKEEDENKDSVIKSSNKPVVSSDNSVLTTVPTSTVTNISVFITKTSSAMSVGEDTKASSILQSYNKFGAPLKRNKRKRIVMKLID